MPFRVTFAAPKPKRPVSVTLAAACARGQVSQGVAAARGRRPAQIDRAGTID